MPAITAPLIGFLLGAFFAWMAAEDLARAGGSLGSRSIWLATTFGLLVYAPTVAYFLAAAPDWSFAYLYDTERLPPITRMVLVLGCAASVPIGFFATAPAASSRKPARAARIAAAPAIATVTLAVASMRRLSAYATYTQYHGDFGVEPVTGSPLGYALLWSAAVLATAILWTVRLLRHIGAAARRD